MNKIEITQNRTLKRQKRMKMGLNNEEPIVAEEQVDEELQSSLKERRKKSKIWRKVREEEMLQAILEKLEK